MYQQSRKLLIFLVVLFLAVQITCIVIAVVDDTGTHLLLGMLQLWIKDWSAPADETNTRGVHPLWHTSVCR